MKPPFVPLGFDYARTVLALNRLKSYAEIASYCGYESANAVYKVTLGAIPSHPQGEALFSMHLELFGTKPPMNQDQVTGVYLANITCGV